MSRNNRNNRIDYIELPADGVGALTAARTFYASVFGWSYTTWGEDYVDTHDSGTGSGLNADAVHRPLAPLAVIFADDLEGRRTDVVKAGGTITKEIFSFPGGRRFHFRDPASNELAVWSDR